jgi:hypothetical protein
MSLFIPPVVRATDENNLILSGAKWYFYVSGTTTPASVYTTSGLTVAHANPVVANSGGSFAPIYLDPAVSYRAVLKTAAGVGLANGDIDPISATGDFVPDGTDAVAGVTAKVNWKIEPPGTAYPVADLGALWPLDKVTWERAISADFSASTAPASGASQSPSATLLLAAHNTGTPTTALALQTITGVHGNSLEGAGVNFITYCDAGLTGVKLKGLEIDIQPGSGATISDAFGLALNAFSQTVGGEAIYIEGVSSGKWSTGIRIGALDTSAGAGIYGAGAMGTLLDTAIGTYGQDAVCFANAHKLRFRGTATTHAKIYNHSDDNLRIVLGAAGLLVRDSTDATSLFSVTSTGFGYPTGVGDGTRSYPVGRAPSLHLRRSCCRESQSSGVCADHYRNPAVDRSRGLQTTRQDFVWPSAT